MQPDRITLRRKQDARADFGGIPNSTWHDWIDRGLMVPPVSIGARVVAYPEHELQAIAVARIAGKSEAEIRALVQALVAARASLADMDRVDIVTPPAHAGYYRQA